MAELGDTINPSISEMEGSAEQIEDQRKSVVACVQAMRKSDNSEGFKSAAVDMFRSFGIKSGEDDYRDQNEQLWEEQYKRWHRHNEYGADIEIRGPNHLYANVYFKSVKIPIKGKAVLVSPGACSTLCIEIRNRPENTF